MPVTVGSFVVRRSTPVKLVPTQVAPERSTPERSAPERSAPLNVAWLKSWPDLNFTPASTALVKLTALPMVMAARSMLVRTAAVKLALPHCAAAPVREPTHVLMSTQLRSAPSHQFLAPGARMSWSPGTTRVKRAGSDEKEFTVQTVLFELQVTLMTGPPGLGHSIIVAKFPNAGLRPNAAADATLLTLASRPSGPSRLPVGIRRNPRVV